MKTVLIFPGQGSQFIGMGRELYHNFAVAKDVFDRIDEALGQDLSRLMFEGSEDELSLTENTQPAIMAVSLAALGVLEADFGFHSDACHFFAGHSLGEYSALTAAKSLTVEDAARLLKIRGRAMQAAAPLGTGAMAALMGAKATIELAEEACAAVSGGGVVVANDNNIGQIVISGLSQAVEEACAEAKKRGAKAMKLNVSAPFHSPLMVSAQGVMREALEKTTLVAPIVPIVCNVTAKSEQDAGNIKDNLVSQVTGRVRWRESVDWMAKEQNITHFIEIGPGKALSGMVKRIAPDTHQFSVHLPAEMNELNRFLRAEEK